MQKYQESEIRVIYTKDEVDAVIELIQKTDKLEKIIHAEDIGIHN